jgi:hypothetical protein
MDIIVTTPKTEMANAAREAADVLAAGGGEYFRRFSLRCYPAQINNGNRVYYVEDGYIRGFGIVSETLYCGDGMQCDTTGRRRWSPGFYVFMDATSWRWIKPIAMRGFQGFRYTGRSYGPVAHGEAAGPADWLTLGGSIYRITIVGNWRDPKPAVPI